MIEYEIKGAEEIYKMLSGLPEKMEVRILRGAVRAGAKTVLDEAQSRAPVRKGALRSSLRVSTRSKRGQVRASVVAGGNKKGGVFYAAMVEGGTKAHVIKARKKSLIVGGGFFRYVNHPGAKANPFMGAALKSKTQEAIDSVAAYIRARLDKLVK